MEELIKLLSLYLKNPLKFDKEVKKSTNKKLKGVDVISEAINTLSAFKEDLQSGALRPVRTDKDLFTVIKLGKHLVGREIYRVWNGGKNGKICSKIVVKGIIIKENSVHLETQAKYSSAAEEPVIRKLNLADLNIVWFLTEEACKEAIERM